MLSNGGGSDGGDVSFFQDAGAGMSILPVVCVYNIYHGISFLMKPRANAVLFITSISIFIII